MRVTITPSTAKGTVKAPPSKSIAHRMLIAGALSDGESVIHGISLSQDINATLRCLVALGAEYKVDGDTVRIGKCKPSAVKKKVLLDCGESGSTLRFLLPLCLLSGKEAILTGSPTLLSRPLDVYSRLCVSQNIECRHEADGIHVCGVLKPGNYKIPGNVSSQFISGLLFALPLLGKPSTITISAPIESVPYIELTLQALSRFGVSAKWTGERTISVGKGGYSPLETTVEGDYSNAAFFDVLNLLGGDVTVEGLDPESKQGDKVYKKMFPLIAAGTPSLHFGDCIDLAPICFALSAALHGGVFNGTRRLAIKESDRANSMAEELRKFGARVTVNEDSVIVLPKEFHAPDGVLDSHNDHRIVMSLSVLLTLVGGTIENAQAVDKSFPGFFDELSSLGIEVKYEND